MSVQETQTPPPQAPAGVPDFNAETYPFQVVVENLNRAAFFHLYSVPECAAHALEGGMHFTLRLHRFETELQLPGQSPEVRAGNRIGEPLARIEFRCKFIEDRYVARPGEEPPEAHYGHGTSGRFVLLDCCCRFDSGDWFRGFGTGSFLAGAGEPSAGAIGTILEGHGRFTGLSGVFTLAGTLDPGAGFRGSLMIRVSDPRGVFGEARSLPGFRLSSSTLVESGITYLFFRGQKLDETQKTVFIQNESGGIAGLVVEQPIRLMTVDTAHGYRGLGATFSVGGIVGSMTSRVQIDLTNLNAPSSNEAPAPFIATNTFRFFDADGELIGAIDTDHGEGRSFPLTLEGIPRQPALRFGAVQPVVRGTGWFEGVEGMLADNSAVGIAPHALTTQYVLRLKDPSGKFRTRMEC